MSGRCGMEMRTVLMARGARKIVDTCAQTRPGDKVLIVTDFGMDPAIPLVLAEAAHALGSEVCEAVVPPVGRDSSEPPKAVRQAMLQADVILTPVSVSITHTQAMWDAVGAGARAVVLTQFTDTMLMRGGIDADFAAIAPQVEAFAARFTEGSQVRVTSPLGTDLAFEITDRIGIAKTCIAAPGDFTPVPDIEAAVSPLEGTAQGRIVADASIPYLGIGRPDRPVTLEIEDGAIVGIEGGNAADRVRAAWAGMGDPLVYNAAELGIGLNPECRLTGNMLEDEGIYGVVHLGTGTSITLGGKVKASCHYDFLMSETTVTVDDDPVVQDGVPLLGRG